MAPPCARATLELLRACVVHRRSWWSGDAGRLFGNRILRTLSHALRIFPVDDRAPGAALEFAGTLLQRGCARGSTICGQRGSSG